MGCLCVVVGPRSCPLLVFCFWFWGSVGACLSVVACVRLGLCVLVGVFAWAGGCGFLWAGVRFGRGVWGPLVFLVGGAGLCVCACPLLSWASLSLLRSLCLSLSPSLSPVCSCSFSCPSVCGWRAVFLG